MSRLLMTGSKEFKIDFCSGHWTVEEFLEELQLSVDGMMELSGGITNLKIEKEYKRLKEKVRP